MTETEKAKRKAKPHRRSRLFIGSSIALVVLFGLMLVALARPLYDEYQRELEFARLASQIALTNDPVPLQLYLTNDQFTASYVASQTMQAFNTATQIAATRAASTPTPSP